MTTVGLLLLVIVLLLVVPVSVVTSQTDPSAIFFMTFASCVNHENYVIEGSVYNLNPEPVWVWGVEASFYGRYGLLPFTAFTQLAFPIIAPGLSSTFTIYVSTAFCPLVTSYRLGVLTSP